MSPWSVSMKYMFMVQANCQYLIALSSILCNLIYKMIFVFFPGGPICHGEGTGIYQHFDL